MLNKHISQQARPLWKLKKLTGILTQLFHEKVIGGSGTMSLILERVSYVNLNFSKQNGHFGIRIEHELEFFFFFFLKT